MKMKSHSKFVVSLQSFPVADSCSCLTLLHRRSGCSSRTADFLGSSRRGVSLRKLKTAARHGRTSTAVDGVAFQYGDVLGLPDGPLTRRRCVQCPRASVFFVSLLLGGFYFVIFPPVVGTVEVGRGVIGVVPSLSRRGAGATRRRRGRDRPGGTTAQEDLPLPRLSWCR